MAQNLLPQPTPFQQCLLKCELTPRGIKELEIHGGVFSIDTLRSIPIKKIGSLLKDCAEKGFQQVKAAAILQARAANTPTFPTFKESPSVRAILAVEGLAEFIEFCDARGEYPDPLQYTDQTKNLFVDRAQQRSRRAESSEIPTPPEPFIVDKEWNSFKERLLIYLSKFYSELAGTPLTYILRDHTDVVPQHFLETYETLDDCLVATASLNTPTAKRDKQRVFDLLWGLLSTGVGATQARKYLKSKDGRAVFLGLRGQLEGEAWIHNRSAAAYKALESAFYLGRNNFTIESYNLAHISAHNELEALGDPMSEPKKIRVYIGGIRDQMLEPIKMMVLGDPIKYDTLEGTMQFIKSCVLNNRAAPVAENRMIGFVQSYGNKASRAFRNGASKKDKKNKFNNSSNFKSRGTYRSTPSSSSSSTRTSADESLVSNKYYPPNEYKQLSKEQKNKLAQLRKSQKKLLSNDRKKKADRKVGMVSLLPNNVSPFTIHPINSYDGDVSTCDMSTVTAPPSESDTPKTTISEMDHFDMVSDGEVPKWSPHFWDSLPRPASFVEIPTPDCNILQYDEDFAKQLEEMTMWSVDSDNDDWIPQDAKVPETRTIGAVSTRGGHFNAPAPTQRSLTQHLTPLAPHPSTTSPEIVYGPQALNAIDISRVRFAAEPPEAIAEPVAMEESTDGMPPLTEATNLEDDFFDDGKPFAVDVPVTQATVPEKTPRFTKNSTNPPVEQSPTFSDDTAEVSKMADACDQLTQTHVNSPTRVPIGPRSTCFSASSPNWNSEPEPNLASHDSFFSSPPNFSFPKQVNITDENIGQIDYFANPFLSALLPGKLFLHRDHPGQTPEWMPHEFFLRLRDHHARVDFAVRGVYQDNSGNCYVLKYAMTTEKFLELKKENTRTSGYVRYLENLLVRPHQLSKHAPISYEDYADGFWRWPVIKTPPPPLIPRLRPCTPMAEVTPVTKKNKK